MEELTRGGGTPAVGAEPARNPGPRARSSRWRAGVALGSAVLLLGGAAVTMAASPSPSTSPSPDDGDGDRRGRIGGPAAGLFDGFVGFAGPHGGLGLGNITIAAIDGSSLTLSTVDGWTRTVEVTDDTELTREGEDIGLSDLEVGDRIRFGQVEEDGVYTVTGIEVVLPRVIGQVTAVDGDGLTLELPDGSTKTVRVDGETAVTVRGESDMTLSDIETGMVAIVAGEETGDGSIDAESIRAGSIWERFGPGGEGDEDGERPFRRGFRPFHGGGPFEVPPLWDDDADEPASSSVPSSDTSAG